MIDILANIPIVIQLAMLLLVMALFDPTNFLDEYQKKYPNQAWLCGITRFVCLMAVFITAISICITAIVQGWIHGVQPIMDIPAPQGKTLGEVLWHGIKAGAVAAALFLIADALFTVCKKALKKIWG